MEGEETTCSVFVALLYFYSLSAPTLHHLEIPWEETDTSDSTVHCTPMFPGCPTCHWSTAQNGQGLRDWITVWHTLYWYPYFFQCTVYLYPYLLWAPHLSSLEYCRKWAGKRLSDSTVPSRSGSWYSCVLRMRPTTSSLTSFQQKSERFSWTSVMRMRRWIPWCSMKVPRVGMSPEWSTTTGTYLWGRRFER